jgi:hypothetical protein
MPAYNLNSLCESTQRSEIALHDMKMDIKRVEEKVDGIRSLIQGLINSQRVTSNRGISHRYKLHFKRYN